MRVLINALKLDEGPSRHLVGNFYHVYYFTLALSKIPNIEVNVLVDEVTYPIFLKNVPLASLVLVKLGDKTLSKILRADFAVLKYTKKLNVDIYHRPTGQLPFPPLTCASISTIADLNFTILKTNLFKRIYKVLSYRWTIRRANYVICISNYTREQVIRKLKSIPEKTSVVYLGTNILPEPSFKISKKYGNDFWLTFGHQTHKNVESCIFSIKHYYEIFGERNHLIVVGENPYIRNVLIPLADKLGLSNFIHFIGCITLNELHGLYKKAHCLLFLSSYEGFGMPVLEAMSSGCPVICSNVCSLPEICSDAAIICDPKDTGNISNYMHKVKTEKIIRNLLIKKGKIRASFFSWDKTAMETVSIYEKVLKI